MTKVDLVIDLQFGSTGKGSLAYLLASHLGHDTVCTAWAPNAGHTTQIATGERFVHTMLASSMLVDSVRTPLIGPGSVVNMSALVNEVKAAGRLVTGKQVIIHPNSCILHPRHADTERVLVRVGSTMKGSAAAVVEKMMRDPLNPPLARFMPKALFDMAVARLDMCGVTFTMGEEVYNACLDASKRLLVEGAQGFSLGMHTEFWPHCTARDISPAQLFADCRLPFELAHAAEVWGVARTFPIRVANRFNDLGDMIGTSGPGYFDQQELEWSALGREPELTTVTKLPRRIFEFSSAQIKQACRICNPMCITLTFADYIQPRPEINGRIGPALGKLVDQIEFWTGIPVRLLTFGPSIDDAVILRDDVVRWLNPGNFVKYVMGVDNDGLE